MPNWSWPAVSRYDMWWFTSACASTTRNDRRIPVAAWQSWARFFSGIDPRRVGGVRWMKQAFSVNHWKKIFFFFFTEILLKLCQKFSNVQSFAQFSATIWWFWVLVILQNFVKFKKNRHENRRIDFLFWQEFAKFPSNNENSRKMLTKFSKCLVWSGAKDCKQIL